MGYQNELRPGKRFLMGPGPSEVNARVLKAMATPLTGHLDPDFIDMMDDIRQMVQMTFLTENHLTFVVSGPGTAGMETCMVNLLEPGDEALICIHGVFGTRLADMAERSGARVTKITADWGTAIDPDQVRRALRDRAPKLIAIVHAETSTGVLQPLREIANMAREAGALFVVDAVTSWCGTELRVDDWGIDAIYSGSQKCLSAPPGLSPVSFSPRAVEAIERRKSKVQSWFLDLSLVSRYWAGAKRAYHHTAPVSAMYAMREALRIVLEEGLENRWKRHWETHALLKSELEHLGLELLVRPGYRLPMLNTVKIPKGVDDTAVRQQLLQDYQIEIGAGLGQLAGKVWRVGLMGESCTPNHVHLLVSALRKILSKT